MGLNCGAKFAKYVLFFFNIIFFICGAAVLGIGIWVRVDTGSLIAMLNKVDPSQGAGIVAGNILTDNVPYIHTVAYILIGVGSFVFLVGFMGCCGAIKQWRPLLVGYAICLIVICCMEIGVGIAVGVYESEVTNFTERELSKLKTKYDSIPAHIDPVNQTIVVGKWGAGIPNDVVVATNTWNAIQSWLGCCGVNGYMDFLAAGVPYSASERGRKSLSPLFCCKMESPTALRVGKYKICEENPKGVVDGLKVSWEDIGCVPKVKDYVTTYAPTIIGVAVGIGLIELIGVFFAFCLCCAIADKRAKY